MQRPDKKPQSGQRRTNRQQTGRVVDIRAFRAKKRVDKIRGQRNWSHVVLIWVAWLLAGIGAASAVGGCIPSPYQLQLNVLAWFFATLAGVSGLWLNAIGYRRAVRLLIVVGLTMLTALVLAVLLAALPSHAF